MDFKILTIVVLDTNLAISIGLEVFCEQVNKELLQQSNIYIETAKLSQNNWMKSFLNEHTYFFVSEFSSILITIMAFVYK